MPLTRDRRQLPDNAKPVADLIETFGFQWTFDRDHPLPAIERRIQIRDGAHNAPRFQVTQYAEAMKRGDVFPPIIVTKDGYIDDGNTRVHAARQARRATLPTFILDEPLDGSTEQVRQRLRALGAGLNIRNGRGIDRNEIVTAVLHLAENPAYTAVRIGALLSVTEATVNGILAERRAEERAKRLGVPNNGSLSVTLLRRLGRASARLNDTPFRALFNLAQDAGLKEDELSTLIKHVQVAGSDHEAIRIVEADRAARREQIALYKASGKSRPLVPAQLRQHLGFVNGFENHVGALMETNPTIARDHLAIMRRSVSVLDIAISLQEHAIDKRDKGE